MTGVAAIDAYLAACREPPVALALYLAAGVLGARSTSQAVRLASLGVVGCVWMLAITIVQPGPAADLTASLALAVNAFAAAVAALGPPIVAVDRRLRGRLAILRRPTVMYLAPVVRAFGVLVWAASAAFFIAAAKDQLVAGLEIAYAAAVWAACLGLVRADRALRHGWPGRPGGSGTSRCASRRQTRRLC